MIMKEKTKWYLGIFGFVAFVWQLIFFFILPNNLFFLLIADSHFIGVSFIILFNVVLPWIFFSFLASSESTSLIKRRAGYLYVIAFLLFTFAIYGALLLVIPRYGVGRALFAVGVAILDAVVLVLVTIASKYRIVGRRSRAELEH
ncbi:MAG: hypothetical protein LVQ96_02030 [Thermoplasmatales archaeon]|nr:hypothetical protein [Thermoplasmatales archaeon]MCW6169929.1 hypothetical protein [Thermoplasmatales archaeon]